MPYLVPESKLQAVTVLHLLPGFLVYHQETHERWDRMGEGGGALQGYLVQR